MVRFLKNNLPKGSRIQVDSGQITIDQYNLLEKALTDNGYELKCESQNLVDAVWANDRPTQPLHKVWRYVDKYAG